MGGLSKMEAVPRRLSKPRTKSSIIHISSSDREMDISSPPIPSTQHDYFGDHAAAVSSQGECRSRRKSRSRIRAYLHGPNSDAVQSSSDDEDGQTTLAGTARDVRARISRTGSSIMQLQSAKTSTTRLSNASSSRLLAAGSQSSDAEESVLIADRIKERAYYDSLAAQNHVVSPVDENKHVDSVMAPLRRKSLYTPGLATRNPSDILKKPPQQESNQSQSNRDYYYDPARPKESPLSQLAALQLGEDGRSTPSGMNYPQLGGLQLGTLRVTNASPIPRTSTPDLVCQSPTTGSKVHEEYYTASEGSLAGESLAAVPQRAATPRSVGSKNKASFQSDHLGNTKSSGSFFSQSPTCADGMAHEYISELGGGPFAYSEIVTSKNRNTAEDCSFEDEALLIPQAEGPAAETWRRFIDDAEVRHGGSCSQEDAFRKLNGNTPSVPVSHQLSVPYAANSQYSVFSDTPKPDSGYGSNASLNATQPATECIHVASTSRPLEFPCEVMQGKSPNNTESHDCRRMADHTDQASTQGEVFAPRTLKVRTEHKSRSISGPREMPRHIPEQGRYSLQIVGPEPLPSSFSVMPQNKYANPVRPTARSSPTVMRKLQKLRPKSQPPPANLITVQGYRDLSQAHIPRVPSIIAARHADRLRQFPLLDHTFPSLDHTTSDDAFSPTGACDAAYPLPVRFPSPANALEAASVDYAPGPSPAEEGRKSRPRASSQRRNSIVVHVQEDLWPSSDIVRSPSWSEFGGDGKRKARKRLIKQEKEEEKRLVKEEKELERRLEKDRKSLERQIRRDVSNQKAARSRSASRTRVSPDRSSRDTLATIADFGTVTESLGGNPYDIATAMFSSPSATQNVSNWHPHQISTAMPRPKSTIGMDEVTAIESARARSRDRSESFGWPNMSNEDLLGKGDNSTRRPRPQTMFINAPPMPALAAVDLEAYDLDPVWSRQRNRNSSAARVPITHARSFDDRGGLPGRSIRPWSVDMDAPPVPALPLLQQVRQREAQITQSRPHSMIIEAPPIPALPTSQSVSAGEGEVDTDNSPVPKSEMLVRPRRNRNSRIVPDLWSNGSLEKKGPRSPQKPKEVEAVFDRSSSDEISAPKVDDTWEVQRQAWRQRRKSAAKSAGDAILRNHLTEIFNDSPATSSSAREQRDRSSKPPRAITADPQEYSRPNQDPEPALNPLSSHPYISPSKNIEVASSGPSQSTLIRERPASYHQSTTHQAPRPGPSPLAPHQATPEDHGHALLSKCAQRRASTFTIPRKRVGSGTSTPTKAIDRLIGRYDGGLLYGYEPGCGLGGSAGTRSAKTEASRKSIDVSKGFGLDLSDVPIFVAPTPAM